MHITRSSVVISLSNRGMCDNFCISRSHTHLHAHTHTHTHTHIHICIYHHHVVPLARISLTLSRHFSLSTGLHPVSPHSCCKYVLAGRPAFARPYVGVHRSIYIYIYISSKNEDIGNRFLVRWFNWLEIGQTKRFGCFGRNHEADEPH